MWFPNGVPGMCLRTVIAVLAQLSVLPGENHLSEELLTIYNTKFWEVLKKKYLGLSASKGSKLSYVTFGINLCGRL